MLNGLFISVPRTRSVRLAGLLVAALAVLGAVRGAWAQASAPAPGLPPGPAAQPLDPPAVLTQPGEPQPHAQPVVNGGPSARETAPEGATAQSGASETTQGTPVQAGAEHGPDGVAAAGGAADDAVGGAGTGEGAGEGDPAVRRGLSLDAIKSHPLVEKARAGLVEANPGPLAGEAIKQVSPAHVLKTARENVVARRFIATDLTEHDTPIAAVRQSLGNQSLPVRTRVSLATTFHPVNVGLIVAAPLAMEATRQLASGQGLSLDGFKRALRPLPVAGTMGGLVAGNLAGAAVSTALGRLGPVGTAASFFVQPAMAWTGQLFGTNLGENAEKPGASVRSSLADTLRQIEPGRDTGQIVGGAIGTVVGQVLIPVPMLGSVVGGIVGGMIGAAAGNALVQFGPFKAVNEKIKAWLARKADQIDAGDRPGDDTQRKDPPPSEPAPGPSASPGPAASPGPPPVPAPTPDSRASHQRPASTPVPTGADLPSSDDLRVAAR